MPFPPGAASAKEGDGGAAPPAQQSRPLAPRFRVHADDGWVLRGCVGGCDPKGRDAGGAPAQPTTAPPEGSTNASTSTEASNSHTTAVAAAASPQAAGAG